MYPPEVSRGSRGDGVPLSVPLPKNNGTNVSRANCMARPADYTYTSDVFATAATSWIQNQSGPYFAYVAYATPHAGAWGSNKETGQPVPSDLQYGSEDWPDVEKDHAASVTYMDASVGRWWLGWPYSCQYAAQKHCLSTENPRIVFFLFI